MVVHHSSRLLWFSWIPFAFRVSEVTPDHVVYTVKPTGEIETHTIPSNLVLWTTGIAKNSFTERASDLLPNQVHKKAIEVDAHLRVKGAPFGEVYALGDCATVIDFFRKRASVCSRYSGTFLSLFYFRLRLVSWATLWSLLRLLTRTRMAK